MARVGASILIDAPREAVFRRMVQHDRCSDWLVFVPRASYATEQTRGVGTVARHEGEMLGRRMEWVGEVVDWVDDERVVWRATSGQPERMKMTAFNSVTPEGKKARYGLEIRYEMPYSFVGRVLDLLWVRRRLRQDLQRSLEQPKAAVEEG